MPNSTLQTVIWVDDDIDGFTAFVGRLEAVGLNVHPCRTIREADLKIQQLDGEVDAVIFDVKMQGGQNGLRLAQKVKEHCYPCGVMVFSNYLNEPDVKEKVHEAERVIGDAIVTLDKTMRKTSGSKQHAPSIPRDDSGFAETVRKLVDDTRKRFPRKPPIKPRNNGIKPAKALGIDFDTYITLSSSEKATALEAFRKKNAVAIRSALAQDGAKWVLYIDGQEQPVAIAGNVREMLRGEELLALGRDYEGAIFQFHRDVKIDDIGSHNCSAEDDLVSYPFVRVSLGSEDEVDCHFDTGCLDSFVCSDFVSSVEPKVELSEPFKIGVNGDHGTIVRTFSCPVTIRNIGPQGDGLTPLFSLDGYAVEDWTGSWFARKCTKSCAEKNTGNSDICKFRQKALIGRSIFLDESSWSVTISFPTGEICVEENH